MDKHCSAKPYQNVPDIILKSEKVIPYTPITSDSTSLNPSSILKIEEFLKTDDIATNTAFDEDEEQLDNNKKHNNSNTKISKREESRVTTQLIPTTNSSTNFRTKYTNLKRTLSEHATFGLNKAAKQSIFGSRDSLGNPAVSKFSKPTPLSSSHRRKSLDRPDSLASNLLRMPSSASSKKTEMTVVTGTKGIVTETKDLTKVEPRVNSIRKPISRPRSQIVAAVTQRLYTKSKMKEVSTNTENIKAEGSVPKELNICSNARLKLKELTQRALKAHKNKDEITQTELFPVLRVKEVSTDINDLKIMTKAKKNASTMIEKPSKRDVSTNCAYLDCFDEAKQNEFRNAFVITRSCSTQAESSDNHTFSRDRHPQICERLGRDLPFNSIYTNSVNINISHNYISGHPNDDSTSHDSLDNIPERNTNFQTPDLISNHNSLEPHGKPQVPTETLKEPTANTSVNSANICLLTEPFFAVEDLFIPEVEIAESHYITTPDYCTTLPSIKISNYFVPEVCIVANQECRCLPFPAFFPESAVPRISDDKDFELDDCLTLQEPLLLKSIMKQATAIKFMSAEDCHSENINEDNCLPDSLEFHVRNSKKVRFNEGNTLERDKLIEVMSNFLEEAATLLSSLKITASKLENHHQCLTNEFDLEITVDDISPLSCHHHNRRPGKKYCRHHIRKQGTDSTQTEGLQIKDEFCQTVAVELFDNCEQSDPALPLNKYEVAVENSCERLEEKLHAEPTRNESLLSASSLLNNDSNCSHLFSSESNMFSDYSGLPRRYSINNRSKRLSSCSPSALLRRLTNMRKQVIDSSREELLVDINVK